MSLLCHPLFTYLHPVKTGGASVQKMLSPLGIPEEPPWGGGGHEPLSAIPHEYRNVAVMSVRNPWDWYASFYHYFTRQNGSAMPPVAPFHRQGESFHETVERMILCRPLPGSSPLKIPGLPEVHEAELQARTGEGLYTWYIMRMGLPDTAHMKLLWPASVILQRFGPAFIDTYQLLEGLQIILRSLSIELQLQAAHENAMPRDSEQKRMRNIQAYPGAPEDLWTPDLIELVREQDAAICRLIGYDAPGQKAKNALTCLS